MGIPRSVTMFLRTTSDLSEWTTAFSRNGQNPSIFQPLIASTGVTPRPEGRYER